MELIIAILISLGAFDTPADYTDKLQTIHPVKIENAIVNDDYDGM